MARDQGGKSSGAWIGFSLIRVGMFAAVLAILALLLPAIPFWISAIVAAIVAFCLSFIFLSRPRTELAVQLDRMRRGDAPPRSEPDDDEVEDATIEHSRHDEASSAEPVEAQPHPLSAEPVEAQAPRPADDSGGRG